MKKLKLLLAILAVTLCGSVVAMHQNLYDQKSLEHIVQLEQLSNGQQNEPLYAAPAPSAPLMPREEQSLVVRAPDKSGQLVPVNQTSSKELVIVVPQVKKECYLSPFLLHAATWYEPKSNSEYKPEWDKNWQDLSSFKKDEYRKWREKTMQERRDDFTGSFGRTLNYLSSKPESLAHALCWVKDEGIEIGKTLLYFGSRTLCDESLRYAQRKGLPESLKSYWLIRFGCLWFRYALISCVVNDMYKIAPDAFKFQPNNTLFQYLRGYLGVWMFLEKYMRGGTKSPLMHFFDGRDGGLLRLAAAGWHK